MKYVVVLGDGMADRPLEELDNKTPLDFAHTPTMDRLAQKSEIGMVQTVPEGMSPGSDTANLSALGYDPRKYYSGRSPLEALSIGVDMKDTDVALRCNLVTLSEEDCAYEDRRILDHSSGEITTEEAAELLEVVKETLGREGYRFYLGTSYRHCLVIDRGTVQPLTAPHDVLGQRIGEYLPKDPVLREMMEKSYPALEEHPINRRRRSEGKNPANSCWFWGAGTRPALSSFEGKTGKKGAMISAVDLLKGIAVGSSMKIITVEGANGGLHTNYEGKAKAAVDVLTNGGCDFVYVHVEAPDEMGHQGSAEKKVQSIEALDDKVIRPICEGLEAAGEDFRLLVLPDHPTPVCLRTHTSDAVPYLLYDSREDRHTDSAYTEAAAKATGRFVPEGFRLIDKLMDKN